MCVLLQSRICATCAHTCHQRMCVNLECKHSQVNIGLPRPIDKFSLEHLSESWLKNAAEATEESYIYIYVPRVYAPV